MVREGARGQRRRLDLPTYDLAAANAWVGHDKEAKEAVADCRKLNPGFTVQNWANINWTDNPTFSANTRASSTACARRGCRRSEIEASLRERVRCSSLVDWPVYPRLRGTMQGSSVRAIRACGWAARLFWVSANRAARSQTGASLTASSSLAAKIRRLAGNSKLGDDGAVTSLGNPYRRVRVGP